jgi:hypothetical protein
MNQLSGFVSLHPYFKVHAGKLDEFRAAFAGFISRTRSEQKNVFYEFTVNGDEVSAAKPTRMRKAFSLISTTSEPFSRRRYRSAI